MNFKPEENGVLYTRPTGENTSLTWFGPKIIRVKTWKGDCEPKDFSFARVAEPNAEFEWNATSTPESLILESDDLKVVVDAATGTPEFSSTVKKSFLKEKPGSLKLFENDLPNEEDRQSAELIFQLPEKTGLFGLGQYPYGDLNWRGKKVLLIQGNTMIVNPFILSSDSWGMLWDNASHTEFEDSSDGMKLYSEVADYIDYFICAGDNADQAIAGYRKLTGEAPMLGKWAYGFWQCRERYGSAQELTSIVKESRERNLPLDIIVQDWMYWGGNEYWSGLTYDKDFFGDLEASIEDIHKMNAKVMISIWPILGDETQICKEMDSIDCMFDTRIWNGQRNYDAFNEEARKIYWRYLEEGLFKYGIDAWWMDSTEPDFFGCHNPIENKKGMMRDGKKTAAGSWNRVLNAFGLAATQGVYEGQRSASSEKRVCILSRSAFAGQQRYATVSWSGDIGGSWKIFQEQIPAGLNFCMSGIPYWTTDNGGFHITGMGGEFPRGMKDPAFKEFFLRWFQWSVFCPVMRTHGTAVPREIWQFGEKGETIYDTMEMFDNLRYRLLPYIYSLAGKVTHDAYTMMRGLAMDFPQEEDLYDIKDQYMFGPAFMPCPVTDPLFHIPTGGINLIEKEYFVDLSGNEGVLSESYFDDENLEKLVSSSTTSTIDYNWAGGGPAGVTVEKFTARYEGKLVTGDKKADGLHIKADCCVKVYIDDKEIYNGWVPGEYRDHIVEFAFEPNKSYGLKIEYGHIYGTPSIQLGWFIMADLYTPSDNIPKTRQVIMPASSDWFDFWTGQKITGGSEITAEAPLEIMPLYVKSGSIVPMGPYIEWYNHKEPTPMEIRIYSGSDAEFTLYEDEGDNYNYEKGVYSTITFKWNDKIQSLSISDRKGKFPGMLEKRTFNIIIVNEKNGIGVDISNTPDKVVEYNGSEIAVTL